MTRVAEKVLPRPFWWRC